MSLGRKVEIPLWIIIGTYFSPTYKFHFGFLNYNISNNNNNNNNNRYMRIKFSHYGNKKVDLAFILVPLLVILACI
jgi:hypothetical protein